MITLIVLLLNNIVSLSSEQHLASMSDKYPSEYTHFCSNHKINHSMQLHLEQTVK